MIMKDRLNEYKNWKGSFCFLSNLCALLHYHQLDCTENWLGGMIGYLGFYYSREDLPSREVVLGRNTNFSGMFERFQDQLQSPLMKRKAASAEEYISLAGCLLEDRKLPLVWMNDYYLPYSPYFGMAHYWSLVPILQTGMEEVTIYDNEVRVMNRDTIRNALMDLEQVSLYYSASPSLTWKRRDEEAIIHGLETAVSLFNRTHASSQTGYGIRGMEYFAEDTLQCTDPDVFYNFCYQMKRSSGPEATRKSMAGLCNELHARWPFPEVEENRDRYIYLAGRWEKISNLMYKMSTVMKEDLKVRIASRLKEIIELEKAAMEELAKMLKRFRQVVMEGKNG